MSFPVRQVVYKRATISRVQYFHSSGLDLSELRRENKNYLRQLRQGTLLNSKEVINETYRPASASTSTSNSSKDECNPVQENHHWDNSTGKNVYQRNRPDQVQQTKKKTRTFVSFFDKVDAKMKIKRGPGNLDAMGRDTSHHSSPSNFDRLFNVLNKSSESESSSSSSPNRTVNATSSTPLFSSIFEAFPIPKKEINPNAYERESFQVYQRSIREVLDSDKFQRKNTKKPLVEEYLKPIMDWLLRDEKIIPYHYSSLKEASFTDKAKTTRMDFQKQLHHQKKAFLEKTKLTEQQYSLALKAFTVLASNCAKHGSEEPLLIAWEKIKEAGMAPCSNTINVFLYVTGTMMSSGFLTSIHRSNRGMKRGLSGVMNILGSRDSSDKENIDDEYDVTIDFATELALFHDLLYDPTEKSISLRVKRFVALGDAESAEALLDSFPATSDAKLRTYLPVLKLYCEQANLPSALRLFKRMRNENSVRLESENYVMLLSSLAENGAFRHSSSPIEGAYDLGYIHASGPGLFDEIVAEMAEDVVEISSAGARRIHNALAMCFQGENSVGAVEPINTMAGVQENNKLAENHELILSRVTVEKTTGLCPRSGVKLQLIKLKKDEQLQLYKSLLELSKQKFEDYTAGINNDSKGDHFAAEQLSHFATWLNERNGEPFTAIVDGANVAYYMQNFHQGSFNFYQIQFMVDALKKMKENPLVILPFKYCSKSFWISSTTSGSARKQFLTNEENDILEKFNEEGRLYRVPPRCLDDYYWMLASVSDQTKSRKGANLDVGADNSDGRWPGTRPMLVTNDQMRDHRLGFLEPRLFRRWTSCYIVNYNFTAFVGAECADREIGFSTADFFSREIQKSDSSSGSVWHFPVSDWPLNDRFCVRIPSVI